MSTESHNDNKRIAKNTVALYFRMIIMMLVGLYTSRVILQALGVEDFGIYNVVGGFVSMFSLISSSLSGAVSRFLTYELGVGNKHKLETVFSTSTYVMAGLSALVILSVETFGLWYLYNKMVIPADRLDACFWVFQISVFTFVMTLINTPYNASIISHERMGVYAYISIFDAICKLVVSYLVMVSPIDRLIYYSLLLALVSIVDQIVYVVYCKRNFEECTLQWVFDKHLFKQMFGFAGWNFIGSSAAVLRTQGANLLLNAFGGPVVNAANGIANNITDKVYGFVNNFTQAFNPQITKKYAAREYDSLMNLLIYGSKYAYYLMFLLSLPLMINTEYILRLWLGIVPEHTVNFARWTFIFLLAESVSRPIITAKSANGNIRNYQIVVGGIILLTLPIAYIGLKLGAPVEFVPFTNALTATLAILARMYMLRGDFPCWSSRMYFTNVILNVLIVSAVSAVFPLIIYFNIEKGFINFLVTTFASVVCTLVVAYFIGCSETERQTIVRPIVEMYKKIRHK